MSAEPSPHFAALRHRNFRLLWIGLLLSFSGSMMQNAALLWHVSLLVAPLCAQTDAAAPKPTKDIVATATDEDGSYDATPVPLHVISPNSAPVALGQ